eukprot:TRINITY_DN2678_c0_g1_i2.p1 TRINITY_DN2678_c0_g1~~TRINITY_DN2678_c0_g1_i2.p1  ORF type:complete len:154 (+),score=34.71 TRINITY_DN2678_c0_g1_i2:159-620(+)
MVGVITCKHCGKEGDHLSKSCPQRPPGDAGSCPPAGVDDYDEHEVEASDKVVAELQVENLIHKGYMSPQPHPDQLQAVTPNSTVAVADAETVKGALGLHWFSEMRHYCSRKGCVVRILNERNAYVAFENEEPIDTVTSSRITFPIACLTPVSK